MQVDNSMAPETLGIIYIIKTYAFVTCMAILGGIAHALEAVRNTGWKGWFNFISDIIVSVFFGQIFYQIGLLYDPKYAIILVSIGSFWGVKSFDYIKCAFIKSLKANIE